MRPVVVAYRADWPDRAASLAASLREKLAPLAERVEHIGSTAIPGMAAKDILDMQVSVADLEQAAGHFDVPLAGLGFERSRYQSDHVPAGRDDDPRRWAKRLWLRRGRLGDVNLHVRRSGSPNERLALLFRDWFRAHPDAIAGYAAFKTALAAALPDLDAYSDVKDPVVDVVIAAAEEWAAAVGWPGAAPGKYQRHLFRTAPPRAHTRPRLPARGARRGGWAGPGAATSDDRGTAYWYPEHDAVLVQAGRNA